MRQRVNIKCIWKRKERKKENNKKNDQLSCAHAHPQKCMLFHGRKWNEKKLSICIRVRIVYRVSRLCIMPQHTIATPTCQKLESTQKSSLSLSLPLSLCLSGLSFTHTNDVRMFAKTVVCLIYAYRRRITILQLYTKQDSYIHLVFEQQAKLW